MTSLYYGKPPEYWTALHERAQSLDCEKLIDEIVAKNHEIVRLRGLVDFAHHRGKEIAAMLSEDNRNRFPGSCVDG